MPEIMQIILWSMGIFLIIVSILKMLDWKGFAIAYYKYDLISRFLTKGYAWLYPIIELGLGIGFLFSYYLQPIAWITLILMSINAISVFRILKLGDHKIKCACLGTMFKIPLTKFTLFEDLLMIVMSIMIILPPGTLSFF